MNECVCVCVNQCRVRCNYFFHSMMHLGTRLEARLSIINKCCMQFGDFLTPKKGQAVKMLK